MLEVNRAMTLKESSKIGSFFCVYFATAMPLQEQNKKQLTDCNANGSPAMRRAPVIFCGGKRMKKTNLYRRRNPYP